MIPFADMVNRWQSNSQVPMFVGTAPEGTHPPYASLNLVQSNPVNLSGNARIWNESLIQIAAVTDTLADSETLAESISQVFDLKTFGAVVDMGLLNRSTNYSDQPGLTGNRTWMTILEFRIRH